MARYMLVCRSVDFFGNLTIGYKTDVVGFVRYFATKDEALTRGRRFKCRKYADGAVEVFV